MPKHKKHKKAHCAGRNSKGQIKKGYKPKKGHSCPVKA